MPRSGSGTLGAGGAPACKQSCCPLTHSGSLRTQPSPGIFPVSATERSFYGDRHASSLCGQRGSH